MVDKNLFLYDLSAVAIMKDAEPYIKEWLDYHLLAGIDHFYIYDNESSPEFKKLLQPYIDAGIVTYTFFPGKTRQMDTYNDAIQRFRFESRYVIFIDDDEFIFPKSNSTIIELVDELLPKFQNCAGLGIGSMFFGSNGQEKADFSRGVLERFTKRRATIAAATKTVTNPRLVDYYWTPHFPNYFEGRFFNLDEGTAKFLKLDYTIEDKVVLNHYHTKSREEYRLKKQRGDAVFNREDTKYNDADFDSRGYENEVFDDSILKYLESRKAALIPTGGIKNLFQQKQINYHRLFNALIQNIIHTTFTGIPKDFYVGRMETFLTCLNVSSFLKGKFFDDKAAKFFEEISLDAIHKTFFAGVTLSDVLLLFSEMPKLLKMPYPIINTIRQDIIEFLPRLLESLKRSVNYDKDLRIWEKIIAIEYRLNLLKSFK